MKSLRKTATALASLVMLIAASRVEAAPVLLVGNAQTGSVLRFDASSGAGQGTFIAGTGAGNPNGPANAFGLAFGPNGNLFVSDLGGNAVRQYNGTTGAFVNNFVPPGSAGGAPFDLTFGPGNILSVASVTSDAVLRFNATTGALIGSSAAADPTGLVIRGNDLFVSESSLNRISRFDAVTGASLGVFATGGGLGGPSDLVFGGPSGNLFVANDVGDNILEFNGVTGAFIRALTGGPLLDPIGLSFGPDGNLYVASSRNNLILRYNPISGTFIDTFASGNGLNTPTFLVFGDLPVVPEPGSIALVAVGGLGLVAFRRVRKGRRTA